MAKSDRPLSAKEQAFHRRHQAHGTVRVVPLKHPERAGVLHHCEKCDKAHFEARKK